MRGARIILGIIILVFSCMLLIWSLAPMRRVIRTQPISPTELQLPTPSSLIVPPSLGIQPTFVL